MGSARFLRDLGKVLTNMSSSMLSMELKNRKRRDEQEDEAESDASDGEHLLNTTEPRPTRPQRVKQVSNVLDSNMTLC